MPQKKIGFYGKLQPTGIDGSESARLQTIAALSDQVGNIAFQIGAKQRKKQGIIEGAQAGIDAAKSGEAPQTKDGLFSIYDQAYDESMKSAYVASIDNANQAKFSELANKYSLDAEGFIKASNKYKAGVLGGLDQETQLMLAPSMDKSISNVANKIQVNQRTDALNKADAVQQIGIKNQTNNALNFAFEGDFNSAAQSIEAAKALLQVRLNTGKITGVEYNDQLNELVDSVDSEVNRFQFNNLLKENNVTKATNFIQKVHDLKIKGKSVEWHRNMVDTLTKDMTNHFSLINKQEKDAKDKAVESQKNTSSEMTLSLFDGDLTYSQIRVGVKSGSISPEQGKVLANALSNTGGGVDDYNLILNINEYIKSDPEKAKELINSSMGTTLTGKTAESLYKLALSSEKEIKTGGDPVLTGSKAKRFRKLLKDTVKIQDKWGGFNTEKQKLAAKLEVVYDERVLNGEDPALVAKDLLAVDTASDVGELKFGSINDLDAAESELIEAYKAQSGEQRKWIIQPDEFDYEMEKIQKLRDSQTLLTNFNTAYEAALNGQ